MAADTTFDGAVDLKTAYHLGEKIKTEKDGDGDGYFETVEWFDRPGWDRVTELDHNANRIVESRFFFSEGVLRRREFDDNEDGRADLIESLSAAGQLERAEEMDPDSGRVRLVWLYDEAANPWCAEEDRDGDGVFETRFFYENGRLYAVEEDTNADGKVDLWETYDEAEVLVSTRQDFDYDGVPDMVRDKTGSWPLLAARGNAVEDKTRKPH
jgi:hypothetical protein